jgi:hypothetical protein
MADHVESAEHTSRTRAREGGASLPCGCRQDAAGFEILCPHHSKFEEDGTPRELPDHPSDQASKDTTAQETERASTLLAALAGDTRAFVATFDFELNASGLSGKKRAFLYTLIRLTYKGKACAYAGVAPSTVSGWRKDDAVFRALEELAEAILVEAFEAELDRRAFEGVQKPVFGKLEGPHSGNGVIGYVREYSDRLAEIRMRALAPERYRDKGEKPGSSNAPDVAQLRTDIAAKLKRAAEVKRLSPAQDASESETSKNH